MAYSSPEQKSEILDNEHNCKYKFDFQKALLIVKPSKKVVSASQEFIACTTSEYKIKSQCIDTGFSFYAGYFC